MFDKNILTFNPGFNQKAKPLDSFTDVRELEKNIQDTGIKLTTKTDSTKSSGPASITLTDPDGNPILIDQHI